MAVCKLVIVIFKKKKFNCLVLIKIYVDFIYFGVYFSVEICLDGHITY